MIVRTFTLFVMMIVPAATAQQLAIQPTKTEIERMIKDYIIQHPEVLVESMRVYEERARAVQQQKVRYELAARQSELLSDPTSPATKTEAKPGEEVSVIEFFDYRCGFCKRVSPTVMKLLADNPNVRVVFKELPILGSDSVTAAKAALAAEKQGKYLKFHQAMMTLAAPINAATIEQIGHELGLDVAKMKTDMETPEIAAIIARNARLASAIDVSSTPTFVIGSEIVAGTIGADVFQKLIADAPKKQ